MNLLRASVLAFWLGLFSATAAAWNAGRSSDFFGLTNLWTIHLTISSNDWTAMEPPVRQRGPFGPGGPEGRRGPPRDGERGAEAFPDGRPPGGRGFGPLGPPPDQAGPDTRPGDRAPNEGDGFRPRRPGGPPPGGGPGMGMGPMGLEFPWAKADLEFGGATLTNVGVRFKGNSSFNAARGALKKPFKLDFDRHSKGRTFFGLEELFLNNNVNPLAHLREPLAYDAFRRAGLPASRTAFVRIYLTIPGQFDRRYLGLYTAVEPVEGHFLEQALGDHKGLLVKPERVPGLNYLGDNWDRYTNRYELRSKYHAKDARRLIELTRFVSEASDAEFSARLGDRVDVDEALRFVAVNALLANLDSFLGNGHNYYLHIPRQSGRAMFIPWDLNEAFGGHPGGGPSRDQAELSVLRPAQPGNRFVARLLADGGFASRYRLICEGLLTNAFNADRLIADAGRIEAVTQDALREESAGIRRGPGAGPLGGGEPRPPADGGPRGEGRGPGPGGGRGPGVGPGRMADMPIAEWIRLRDTNVREELAGRREGVLPRMGRMGPPPVRPERF